MAAEPSWNKIIAKVVSAMTRINTAATTAYWNTVRTVYEDPPDQWDTSSLPAVTVTYDVSQQAARVYAGGSRTVSDSMLVMLEGRMVDDGKAGVSVQKKLFRLAADMHRAVYVEPNLGLAFVKRVTFPLPPEMTSGSESGEVAVVGFKYAVVVEYSYQDDQP